MSRRHYRHPWFALLMGGVVGVGVWFRADDLPQRTAQQMPELAPQLLSAHRSPSPMNVQAALVAQPRAEARQLAFSLERALLAPDPAARVTALHAVLPELVSQDPALVARMLAGLPVGEARDALRDELARRWSRHDLPAAAQWAQGLEEPDRSIAGSIALRSLAARSPVEAVVFARYTGIGFDDGTLEHLVQIWAAEDPYAAARWARSTQGDAALARLHARLASLLPEAP